MRWIGIVMVMVGMLGCAAKQDTSGDGDAQTALAEGNGAMERGDFESAARQFETAGSAGDERGRAEAMIQLAHAQQMLGRFDLATRSLKNAIGLADKVEDQLLKARALNGLGVALTFSGAGAHAHHDQAATMPASWPVDDVHDANGVLQRALGLAREAKDARLEASVLTNLGNYHAKAGHYAMARRFYDDAARIAPDELTEARAWINSAVAQLTAAEGMEKGKDVAVVAMNDTINQGLAKLERVGDSHEKAFLYLTAGRTAEQAGEVDLNMTQTQRAMARSSYQKAQAIAEKIGDVRSQSYAYGYLGGLALAEGKREEAEKLTRRAIMAAQQMRSPDALYRWQWQNARILVQKWKELKTPADLAAAAASYDAAVQTVKFIRNDISLGHGNQRKQLSFRENIGSLYFEYADVLLQRSDSSVDKNELYKQARGTIEQLKAVELENYFQDECVSLIKRKQKELEDIDGTTAVVYMIPLADRVEILVSFRGGQFYREKNDKTNKAKLEALAKEFRKRMAAASTTVIYYEKYKDTGRELYDALIKPIRAELDARGITTLVFVPDGQLRTIPMAALVDEKRMHLVESFAIGISPGLELLEPRSIAAAAQAEVLAMGLSIKLEGKEFEKFSALTYVPKELDSVKAAYPRAKQLQDKSFTPESLKAELDAETYSIVHIATHAQFGATARDSFLLTSKGKMQLDEVERLIRPYQLRNQPVELLTLSACQTAEGDQERAALGLAGIAVKAGARSAVATLWSVDEQASVELVRLFYEELKKPKVSKAQALQAAQKRFIQGGLNGKNDEFPLPYYWAPFVVIGNWL